MDVKTLVKFEEAVYDAAQTIANTFCPIWKDLSVRCQELYDIIFSSYLKADAPYGETHDGMMRWLRELGEIERMKWEIAKIESDHRCLANLRAKVHGS